MVLKNSRGVALRYAGVVKNKRYWEYGQDFDLVRIDTELNAVLRRSRMLADELGIRYAVFRSTNNYGCGQEGPGQDILRLSREADRCIEEVHRLEEQRRELLEQLDS